MTEQRYNELMECGQATLENGPTALLTEKEMSQGWHFCADWDDLLVGPGMSEQSYCSCFAHRRPRKQHKKLKPHPYKPEF